MKRIKSVNQSVSLGIDPSISSTGFCFVNNKDNRVMDYGAIKTSKEKTTPQRIELIKGELHQLIDQHRPGVIIIEGLSFGSGGQSTRDLAGLFHVLLNHMMNFVLNSDVYVISPKTLKKRFAEHGKAKKEDMEDALFHKDELFFDKLQKIPKNSGRFDIVDAYALSVQYSEVTEEERMI